MDERNPASIFQTVLRINTCKSPFTSMTTLTCPGMLLMSVSRYPITVYMTTANITTRYIVHHRSYNMFYHSASQITLRATFCRHLPSDLHDAFPSTARMTGQTLEARIIFAIEAIQTTPQLTIRHAAKLYCVPRSIL